MREKRLVISQNVGYNLPAIFMELLSCNNQQLFHNDRTSSPEPTKALRGYQMSLALFTVML